MKMRRIFAGSIVALLLAASSLAAACDLSCAFAPLMSDCHSQQTEARISQSTGMKMDGMAMAGMSMPEMSSGASADQRMVPAPSPGMPSHAAIVDMGACEHQSCDQNPVLAVKANHPTAPNTHAILAFVTLPHVAGLQETARHVRDHLAPPGQVSQSLIVLSLRV